MGLLLHRSAKAAPRSPFFARGPVPVRLRYVRGTMRYGAVRRPRRALRWAPRQQECAGATVGDETCACIRTAEVPAVVRMLSW